MLKSTAKKIIYQVNARAPEKILPLLDGKSIVSFDVFDTLLKRDVAAPEDVFTLMERELRAEKPESEGFAELRKEAEKRARQVCADREVTLPDIYAQMPFDDAVRQELMDIECRMELELSTPNLPVQKVYSACLEQGKKILFLSDMYLSAETVRKLLEKNGYPEGTLYVSSESGFTKRSGSLFSYVREQESIDKSQWLHIGDNILSDQMVPRRMGIRSALIDRDPHNNKYFDKKRYKRSVDYRQLNHFIDTRLPQYTDPYEQIGYAVLGPILYGFSKWLEKEIPEDETIVFLAREGELLQRSFEVVSTRPSVYLYISRHAAIGAYISQLESSDEMSNVRMWTIKKGHTQKELAMSCGLSCEEVQTAFSQIGLDADRVITSADMEASVLKAIWPVAKQRAEKQRHLLERYLAQLGVSKSCAAVDVGWRGTILVLLNGAELKRAKDTIRWEGYYMGVHEKPDSTAFYEENIKGFFYDKDPSPSRKRREACIRSTLGFFETMFLSTDGTTKGYDEDESGYVYPVKGEPDNEVSSVIVSIKAIQEAGMQFVCDINASPMKEWIQPNPTLSIRNYITFANNISFSTLQLLRRFRTRNDNQGNSLVNDHGLIYYIFHPSRFMPDFMMNECKAWFLKGVFKLPLPYASVVAMARRMLLK